MAATLPAQFQNNKLLGEFQTNMADNTGFLLIIYYTLRETKFSPSR
jgi:hypothetical protein